MTPGDERVTMPGLAGRQYARLQRWYARPDGRRLRQLRRQLGLSQAKLAARAGVSATTVARLERPDCVTCRSYILARVAAALGEHPARLQKTPARARLSPARHGPVPPCPAQGRRPKAIRPM
jgi:DNA-binding XRE family transcriptional regulator